MLGINRKLVDYENQGKYIRVGLVGAGQMGRGMVSQIEGMKGIRVVALADIDIENARNAYLKADIHLTDIVETDVLEKANIAISSDKVVATTNANLVTRIPEVDVVVEATGIPNVGAVVASSAILNRKHVVMLNVETDVTVGPFLKKMADAVGVVYTGSAGDEPGAIMELFDFADAVGFEVVALGKGKNNKLNHEANPETAREEAIQKGASPKMLASFQDGTKTMVEMTAVANATGFVPDIDGMHGPTATVKELPSVIIPKEDGGILSRKRVVEYVNGVAPGVFAIIKTNHPEVDHELQYLKLGEGPYYVLYRPYHLASLETPLSIAKAYFDGSPTIAPWYGNVAEAVAVAKKDLKEGEYLDNIGGFTTYATILTREQAVKENALPIGLVDQHIVMTRAVKKGEIITYDSIHQTKPSTIWSLRELQDNGLII
ncbi:NAD(P)H-dependent oxidoreductase [Ornithinibacillus sp. 179-J 7C1 HS]|uniref:NAD(P)H-dependent oxidoreductase n=1 Tax=Ornithinibacillus sp. 179-J 7C1 HS TaxID=3142384 RepID=UPI0039A28328